MIAIYVLSPSFINRWADMAVEIMKLDDIFDYIGLVAFILASYATLRFCFSVGYSLLMANFQEENYAIAIMLIALILASLTLGLIFAVASYKTLLKILKK